MTRKLALMETGTDFAHALLACRPGLYRDAKYGILFSKQADAIVVFPGQINDYRLKDGRR